MRLEQHRSLWGTIDIADGEAARSPYKDFDSLIPVLAKLGYDGIEMPFKQVLGVGVDKVKATLKKYGMRITVMVFTDNVVVPGDPNGSFLWGGPYEGYSAPTTRAELQAALAERLEKLTSDRTGSSYEELEKDLTPLQKKVIETHARVFKEQVEAAYKVFGCRRKEADGLLTLCNSHSMKDSFTHPMAAEFFRNVLPWEKQNGYVVAHETHRHRFLYSPYDTRDFLLKYPDIKKDLRMCADLSHWINVAETDCGDPVLQKAIEFIIPNVVHMHCRVGYEEGPQVPDPRSPEWISYMEGHEYWWDLIWKYQKEVGKFVYTTMIAEHGPPNYQVCQVGGTREPLALISDVNHWIHLRRQKRFEKLFGASNGQTSTLTVSETQGFEPETDPPSE